MSHFLPVDVPAGRKSRAWYARTPATRAVVFVHGFGGDPLDTWMRFPHILPGDPKCAGHDLYFFGYDSLRRQAAFSAAEFGKFLRDLFVAPAGVVRSSSPRIADQRPASFQYERVIIICHSLGAVVVRRALLDLAADAAMRPYLANVRVVLFAPAHLGARDVADLASEALGALKLKVVGLFIKFDWTVLDDLKEGSPTLEQLLEDTKAEYAESVKLGVPVHHVVAEAVVHAEFDKIIIQNRFFKDPQMIPAKGQSHTSVCKPQDGYLDPVRYVVAAL